MTTSCWQVIQRVLPERIGATKGSDGSSYPARDSGRWAEEERRSSSFSESKCSVTNTPDHPRQQSPQHVSWPLSLQRAVWVNTSREEPSGEALQPSLLGPENTRGFDACSKQGLSPQDAVAALGHGPAPGLALVWRPHLGGSTSSSGFNITASSEREASGLLSLSRVALGR